MYNTGNILLDLGWIPSSLSLDLRCSSPTLVRAPHVVAWTTWWKDEKNRDCIDEFDVELLNTTLYRIYYDIIIKSLSSLMTYVIYFPYKHGFSI